MKFVYQFSKKRSIKTLKQNLRTFLNFVHQLPFGSWCVSWNLLTEAPIKKKKTPNNRISNNIKSEYVNEVKEWIKQGWLKQFEGKCNSIIPLWQ